MSRQLNAKHLLFVAAAVAGSCTTEVGRDDDVAVGSATSSEVGVGTDETGERADSASDATTGLDSFDAACEAYEDRRAVCGLDPGLEPVLPCSVFGLDTLDVTEVEACSDAYLEYFSCLSSADCDALQQDPRTVCPAEHEAGRSACSLFTFCYSSMGSVGDDACGLELSDCIDGLDQTTTCTVTDGTATCSCMHGDTMVGSFQFELDPGIRCNGAVLGEDIDRSCDFPD